MLCVHFFLAVFANDDQFNVNFSFVILQTTNNKNNIHFTSMNETLKSEVAITLQQSLLCVVSGVFGMISSSRSIQRVAKNIKRQRKMAKVKDKN